MWNLRPHQDVHSNQTDGFNHHGMDEYTLAEAWAPLRQLWRIRLLKYLLLCVIFGTTLGLQAQSNVVSNGSFEIWLADWQTTGCCYAGHINELGADGRNYFELFPGAGIWQDVPTIPGR